jgi:hypothetical protein
MNSHPVCNECGGKGCEKCHNGWECTGEGCNKCEMGWKLGQQFDEDFFDRMEDLTKHV